jgi:hypothetical protein
MRKWSLITAILLLSSAWIVAQSGSMQQPAGNAQSNQPTSQQPDASQQKEPVGADHGAKSIEGCVTSAAGGFTITDNSGKTYQLAGDTSQLQAGQYDRISGTEDTSGAAASGGAPSTFTVRKVKVVSTTCPTK